MWNKIILRNVVENCLHFMKTINPKIQGSKQPNIKKPYQCTLYSLVKNWKQKTENFLNNQKKGHITYKRTFKIRIKADFSSETLMERYLKSTKRKKKKKYIAACNSLPRKNIFKTEREKKIFSQTNKSWENSLPADQQKKKC